MKRSAGFSGQPLSRATIFEVVYVDDLVVVAVENQRHSLLFFFTAFLLNGLANCSRAHS
jgi:hypothetical protein